MCAPRHTSYALAALLAMANATAQTTYPDCYIQNVDWTSGDHFVVMPQAIYSPGDGSAPASSTGAANTEFVSATQIRLMPGFHAGDLAGDGRFRAHINSWMGDPEDLVVISPDASNIQDDILHVAKWEKLEIGYRLPQDYQDAIEGFFDRFYPSSSTGNYTSDPDNVDPVHDLNPYADDSLQLVMTLTDPNGNARRKWGFFMKEATWNNPDPDLALLTEDLNSPLYPYNVRFRFAPDVEGQWQFSLLIKAPLTLNTSEQPLSEVFYGGYSFICDPPLPDNLGPLSVNPNNKRTLWFEPDPQIPNDETPFFGLGVNMSDVRHEYPPPGSNFDSEKLYQRDFDIMKTTMEQLHEVGGNFMRMFLMRNLFSPEWVNLGVYDRYKYVASQPCASAASYNGSGQCNAWAFDQMLDHAHSNGIYIQLCIDPYPPIIAYETFQWRSHPYVIHFLEPNREDPPYPDPYDMKRFFHSYEPNDPDVPQAVRLYNKGVFYYWKRRYKYIISRWGYSVNLPIIEPFNEIDQMLTYRDEDLTPVPADPQYDICPQNKVPWHADDDLPGAYNDWLTDIIEYVKGEVDAANLVTSPLGETNKMFLTGVGRSTDPNYYLPCTNPNLDLIDVHTAPKELWDVRAGRDDAEWFRDNYTNATNGEKRPFRHGEYSTYGPKTLSGESSARDTYPYFTNYTTSFHNELWASTFFGNFTAGSSWCWERVFWWKDGLKAPLPDVSGNPAQIQTPPSNVLNDQNVMEVGLPVPITVVNKPVHHHFKPLSDLLNHPNWQAYNFFDGDFSAHRHSKQDEVPIGMSSDEEHRIECYWLLREPEKDLAIGWVHNMNAYWDNSWYMKSGDHNMLGCTAPGMQSITLPGFSEGSYYITFIPTRWNTTVAPMDGPDADPDQDASTVTLDLTTEPLLGTVGALLDTLHSDYAFVIAAVTQPFVKSSHLAPTSDSSTVGWDFNVYPNPAHDEIFLQFADDIPRTIVLLDLSGRQVWVRQNMKGALLTLPMSSVAQGAYWVRVLDGTSSRTKKLIVH